MKYLHRLLGRFRKSPSIDAAVHPIDPNANGVLATAAIDMESAETIDPQAKIYAEKLRMELSTFKDQLDVNDLPEMYHYWSNSYIRPMLEEFGASNPDQFFAKYLLESAKACMDESPVFVSVGAGNCDTEVRVAKLLKQQSLSGFIIECLDINPHMLARGKELAEREGVSQHIRAVEVDFNQWIPVDACAGVMANHSLHHVANLEGLFDSVKAAMKQKASFVVSDMIGRNGHQRWPEALCEVRRFWNELPADYRYNQQLKRHEEVYENWDCSNEGFEGIRAQDILPLLIARFHFDVFVAFANVIDVFIDRGFGHNFNREQAWDREFVDRIHAFDEQSLQQGTLTPTHLLAVMSLDSTRPSASSRNLSPEKCVRKPD